METQLLIKDLPIQSASLSLVDVRKLYQRLTSQVREIGQAILAHEQPQVGQTEEEFRQLKEHALEKAFRVSVTIRGTDGSVLVGDSVDVFSSSEVPDDISQIYMSNVTCYRASFNKEPESSFDLTFDFTTHKILDATNPISAPTLNVSHLKVQGYTSSWVEGIAGLVQETIKLKSNRRSWLHRSHIYDIGVLLIGLPWSLYVNWRMSDFIERVLTDKNAILGAAAYIYVTFICLWIYRLLFDYTRWIFPHVELADNKASRNSWHRSLWGIVILGMATEFLAAVLF